MFDFFKKKKNPSSENHLKSLINEIHKHSKYLWSPNDLKGVKAYEELKMLPEAEIKSLIIQLIHHFRDLKIKQASFSNGYNYNSEIYWQYADKIASALIAGLLRRKLNYTEVEWIELFEAYKLLQEELEQYPDYHFSLSQMPINYSIKQIEYYLKENELSDQLRSFISEVVKWKPFSQAESNHYYGSDLLKASKKLTAILRIGSESYSFQLNTNDIGDAVNEQINRIANHIEQYNAIFDLASRVSGAKPSAKFIKALNKQLDEIGLGNYRKTVHNFLKLTLGFQAYSKTTTHEYQHRTYEYTEMLFLCKPSQDFIKGLVWTCHRFSDNETINLLTKLAEKCYTKIPGKGPAAASIGNACVYILGNMKGKDGLGALSRLKLKVRQNNVKKSIDKLLAQGAEKYNVAVEELKEMAVPSFGLEAGTKQIDFDTYRLKLSVDGPKLTQQWIKPDGSLIRSVPSIVKNSPTLKNKLKDVRKELKEIQKVFSAQKKRIDNQFILSREWDYVTFKKYYIDHGLVFPISSKLIWTFSNETKTADAILIDGVWKTINDEMIDWLDTNTKVRLWHPINAEENAIVQWRAKIIELEWKQPFKQAYRELYILTDAEIATKTYSNRMAAHILKQHQFSSLANIRDWKYSLMGAFDDGRYNEVCSKILKTHNIKVEFWIDEINQEDAFNEAGIWLYVATDQVKFKNLEDVTIDLVDVPKIVFSEIMRDVDLFVGVSSVGNDPAWVDNNGERQEYRDYWQTYSFGELNEIAKTRKEILSNLLPRLKKIRDKAKIDGKFLVVEGQLRTYKIHIGSGNILMEPNDQYLCIVPSRKKDSAMNNIFIPFEGDRGLSIVLSKAFLLVNDDKIEDTTITSQIGGY